MLRFPRLRSLAQPLGLGFGLACCSLSAAVSAANGAGEPELIQLWDDLTPTLEQALEYQDRHDSLPESAWFGPDQTSNRQSINQLLDQAVAVLAAPSGQDYRGLIRQRERDIDAARAEIAALKQRRVSAPASALWQQTAGDIDAEITALQTRIEDQRAAIVDLKRRFGAELRGIGLNISDEQLEFLLSTVIGDDVIALGVAFDSVKMVTEQLETLLVDSGEDLTAARRYYGLYALLLSALERLHDQLLTEIGQYLKELDGIETRTGTLLEQSRSLSKNGGRHRRTLAANIEAQQLTLRTAKIYRDYLHDQARDVVDSRRRLAQDIAVAENTYETVKVSGDLVRMVHAGENLLQNLFAREAPPMFTFQNLEMKREFEKLTLKLRESAPGD